jgi:hypothetical protein
VLPSEGGSLKFTSKSSTLRTGQTKGHGLFGAMMMDDDSDEEDEEAIKQLKVQATTSAGNLPSKPKSVVSTDGFTEVQPTKSQSSKPKLLTSSNKKATGTKAEKVPKNFVLRK